MSYTSEVLADSPISYWRLGESSGTTATDARGVANGTYFGGPTLNQTGALQDDANTAVTFDNVDDYVNVADNTAHDFGTGDFTIEAWFKRSTMNDHGYIASKRAHTGVAAGWHIGFNSSNALFFSTHDGTDPTQASVAGSAYLDGEWHLLHGVRTSSGLLIYVDGALIASVVGTARNVDNSTALRIGRLNEASTFFSGSIDEVAVYNTALSAARIAARLSTETTPKTYTINAIVGTAQAACSGVSISAGSSIQNAVNANPTNTTFCLAAGTHTISSSIVPKDGQKFIGIEGQTIISGNNTFAGPAFNRGGNNVTIKNLRVRNFPAGFRGPIIDGQTKSGWLIENVEVSDCGGVGIWMGTQNTVRNCVIRRLGHLGLAGGGSDSLVEGTEVDDCNTDHFSFQNEAGGSKFVRTTRLTIRDCWFHHNYGSGIWYDIENIDGVIEDNLCEDNRWMGIFYEISFAATIRNNIVRRNALIFDSGEIFFGACGILISTSENVDCYGNIVEDNMGGISMYNRPGGDCPSCDLMNVHIHDNTVRYTQGVTGLSSVEDGSNAFTIWNNRWTNNTYHLDTAAGTGRFQWSSGRINASQWRAANQDTAGSFNVIGSSVTKAYSMNAVISGVDIPRTYAMDAVLQDLPDQTIELEHLGPSALNDPALDQDFEIVGSTTRRSRVQQADMLETGGD